MKSKNKWTYIGVNVRVKTKFFWFPIFKFNTWYWMHYYQIEQKPISFNIKDNVWIDKWKTTRLYKSKVL